MPAEIAVKLDLSQLQALQAELPGLVKDALDKIATDAVAEAMTRCPVDTGNLKNSLHVEAAEEGALVRRVADATEYGVFVEFGHLTRRGQAGWVGAVNYVPARPFLLPGVLAACAGFPAAVQTAFVEAAP